MSSDLMRAVTGRNAAQTLELLNHKKYQKILNTADMHGGTPLTYACALGLPDEVILRMIELGADVTKPNKMGATPLMHAVYARLSLAVLTALVKAGANVNGQNATGGTPLQISCVCKAGLATVRALVDLGADPDLPNEHNLVALAFAVRNHNDLDVVDYLATVTKDLNRQSTDPLHAGFTALHFACADHQPAYAALLVKHGANLSVENVAGHVALWYADENTKKAAMGAYHARVHHLT